MGDPDAIYLLPPCSDAGEGRLWCEDPMTCEDFEGLHDECVCAGKGQEPTKYVRADTLARVLDQVIVREEWMPEWAEEWWKHKPGECSWFGMDAGNIDEAPDLRPDLEGSVTLPIIDPDRGGST